MLETPPEIVPEEIPEERFVSTTSPRPRRLVNTVMIEACRVLGKAQGIEFRVPPQVALDNKHELSIEDLCAMSGIRCRRVALTEKWWSRDNGPLLAFQTSSASGIPSLPVSLLFRKSGYDLIGACHDSKQRVSPQVAATLEDEAYIFYRPLPDRPLTIFDVLGNGLRGHYFDLRVLFGAGICGGMLALLTPLVTRHIVDSSIPHSDTNELLHLTLALAVSAFAAALFQLAYGLTLLRLKSKTAVSLQAALWDRLLALPPLFFRQFAVGDLSSRSMGIDQIQELLTSDITSAIFSLFAALFSLAMLFYYSRQLAALATSCTFILLSAAAVVTSKQLRHLRMLQLLNGKLGSLVYTLLSGIAKLRVSGAERDAFALWAERFSEHRQHAVAVQRLSNVQALGGTLYAVGTSVAIFAVVGLSQSVAIGIGTYLAFFAALAQFQAATLTTLGVVPTLLGFVPVYERIKPILETVPESHANHASPGLLNGAIELRNVSFGYAGGPLVLHNVSIKVKPGEFVAIVGPTASGKSTCLRLILGFEQPQTGSVFIDGRPLHALNMHLVRRQLGVVLQNSRPLVGDIFHIIVGTLPLTLDDAWRAARYVGLEEDIRNMPMGMFTPVNHRGRCFSGGQCQRLLLARAIVKQPRILLLDEATSALDNITQELVIRNLKEFAITRIVIAHRLSTIRHADRIYVLDKGCIIEEGTFDELIAKGGLFTCMAERQVA